MQHPHGSGEWRPINVHGSMGSGVKTCIEARSALLLWRRCRIFAARSNLGLGGYVQIWRSINLGITSDVWDLSVSSAPRYSAPQWGRKIRAPRVYFMRSILRLPQRE